jgi:hypothetical protein
VPRERDPASEKPVWMSCRSVMNDARRWSSLASSNDLSSAPGDEFCSGADRLDEFGPFKVLGMLFR